VVPFSHPTYTGSQLRKPLDTMEIEMCAIIFANIQFRVEKQVGGQVVKQMHSPVNE
jgi:hypothetical protein